MKHFFTGLILLTAFTVYSQNWCDQGANWKYSFFTAFYAEGYTQIEYVGDTLISGQSAKKLNKHHYVYNYFNSQSEDYDIGMEYTYENNGVVYLWHNNNWDTLYNFNATIGDSWRMAKQPILNACEENSYLTVTATGTKIINATSLKYLVVDFSFPLSFSDTIVEKIGFIGSYVLPYDFCDGALDGNEGGTFRCYQDDNFMVYKPHYSGNCNDILALPEKPLNNTIRIVPNPAVSQIEIIGDISPNSAITIRDINGKHWHPIVVQSTINISHLPSGIYMLSIAQQSNLTHHRFVIK